MSIVQINDQRRLAGRTQVLTGTDTAAANGADTTIATATDQDCLITGVVIFANAAQTVDLTELEVQAGAAQIQVLVPKASLPQAKLNAADEAVSVDLGPCGYLLEATKTIVIEHTGTGATALDLKWAITYTAAADGGYLV